MRIRAHRVKFVTDPVTGLPALSAGPKAPTLTSKEVEEILGRAPGETPQKQERKDKRHRKE